MDQQTGPGRRKVCVVDDDAAVRDSMRILLESTGMDVVDFASATEFLACGDSGEVSCLILDLHMPGMTGLELLERMHENGTQLPTILISGRSDAAVRERALRAGAVALLDKPVDDDLLMTSLERAFRTH